MIPEFSIVNSRNSKVSAQQKQPIAANTWPRDLSFPAGGGSDIKLVMEHRNKALEIFY